MNGMIGSLRARFAQLEDRERRTLVLGALALAALLIYVAVIEPLYVMLPERRSELETMRSELAVLERIAQEAGVDTEGLDGPRRDDTSLLARVDQVASATGLKSAIRRLQPEGDGSRIRVELASAPFDAVARWLGELDAGHGITVENVSFERADAEGYVDGSLVLTRPL